MINHRASGRFLTLSQLQDAGLRVERQAIQDTIASHHLYIVRRLKAIPDLEFTGLLNRAPILASGAKPSTSLISVLQDIVRYRKQGIGTDANITELTPNKLAVESPVISVRLDLPTFNIVSIAGNVKADPKVLEILIHRPTGTLVSRLQSTVSYLNKQVAEGLSDLLLIRRLIYVRWVQKYGMQASKAIARTNIEVSDSTLSSSALSSYGGMTVQDLCSVPESFQLQFQQLTALVYSFLTYLTINSTVRQAPKVGKRFLERKVLRKVQKLGGRIVSGTQVLIDGSGMTTIRIPGFLAVRLPVDRAIRHLKELLDATKVATFR